MLVNLGAARRLSFEREPVAASLSLDLPSDPSAPGLARRAATRVVGDGLDPGRLDDVLLVVTELVSNAVVHGQGNVVLRLQLEDGVVHGEVIDQGGGFERELRTHGPDDVTGRGLLLVESIASRWGVHEGTTHVWFEVGGASDAPTPEPLLGADERPDALA